MNISASLPSSQARALLSRSLPVVGSSSHSNSQISRLIQMGFGVRAAQLAIDSTSSLEEALEYLMKDEYGWQHPFLPREDGLLCILCGEAAETHQDYAFAAMETMMRTLPRNQSLQAEAVPEQPKIQCLICLEEVSSEWRHPDCYFHVFCVNCVREYVTAKLSGGEEIHCPGQDCPCVLTIEHITLLVGTQLTERYLQFKAKAQLARDPAVKCCRTADCPGYVRFPGSEMDNSASCFICNLKICTLCGELQHPGLTCEQVVDEELESWTKDKPVKRCPNCSRLIEKNEGCDHMTCLVCKHEWCWQCLQAFTGMEHFQFENPDHCRALNADLVLLQPEIEEQPHVNTNNSPWMLVLCAFSCCCFPLMLIFALILLPFLIPKLSLENKDYSCAKAIAVAVGIFLLCLLFDPVIALIFVICVIILSCYHGVKGLRN